jgi:hypothetical protein
VPLEKVDKKLAMWMYRNGVCQPKRFEGEPSTFSKEVHFFDILDRYNQGAGFHFLGDLIIVVTQQGIQWMPLLLLWVIQSKFMTRMRRLAIIGLKTFE